MILLLCLLVAHADQDAYLPAAEAWVDDRLMALAEGVICNGTSPEPSREKLLAGEGDDLGLYDPSYLCMAANMIRGSKRPAQRVGTADTFGPSRDEIDNADQFGVATNLGNDWDSRRDEEHWSHRGAVRYGRSAEHGIQSVGRIYAPKTLFKIDLDPPLALPKTVAIAFEDPATVFERAVAATLGEILLTGNPQGARIPDRLRPLPPMILTLGYNRKSTCASTPSGARRALASPSSALPVLKDVFSDLGGAPVEEGDVFIELPPVFLGPGARIDLPCGGTLEVHP